MLNGSLGDEGLAFVNTNCRHLKGAVAGSWIQRLNDHSSHSGEPQHSAGRGQWVRAVSQLLHTASPPTLPGDLKTVQNFKERHLAVPGTRPSLPKLSVPKSVSFEQSYNQSGFLPEGPLLPDVQAQSPGAKGGSVLETSNSARRHEQTLQHWSCRLFSQANTRLSTAQPYLRMWKEDSITGRGHPIQMSRIFKNLCWVY